MLNSENLHDDRILSLRDWCRLNGISLATGRRLIARGEGPRVIQLSARRMGVRVSDNRNWQDSRTRGRLGAA